MGRLTRIGIGVGAIAVAPTLTGNAFGDVIGLSRDVVEVVLEETSEVAAEEGYATTIRDALVDGGVPIETRPDCEADVDLSMGDQPARLRSLVCTVTTTTGLDLVVEAAARNGQTVLFVLDTDGQLLLELDDPAAVGFLPIAEP